MIKRHLRNVLTYFKRRITSAGREAVNSVVEMLKKRSFGYRNFENFRTAVLTQYCGLNLYQTSGWNAGRAQSSHRLLIANQRSIVVFAKATRNCKQRIVCSLPNPRVVRRNRDKSGHLTIVVLCSRPGTRAIN
jgi:hypothetical protein